MKRHPPAWPCAISGAVGLALLLAFLGCATARDGNPSGWQWCRLLGTEPGLEHQEDLRTLAAWIGDARLVGLGEGQHGTHELHRLAQRVFRYLAERRDFTVFALEVDQAHGAMLDDFVTGKRDDLDQILSQGWWGSQIFYDAALRDVLVWMRAHNAATAKQVHVAGFDMKQPDLAKDLLIAKLKDLDPVAAKRVETSFDSVRRLESFGTFPNVYGYTADLPIDLPVDRSSSVALRVALQVRVSGVTYGAVGFAVDADSAPRATALLDTAAPERSAEASSAGSWFPLEVELVVPPEARRIVLTLFHRGNGTVWFAEPSVDLNGQPIALDVELAEASVRPLMMPNLQVMDYHAVRELPAAPGGRSTLRVECDPRIDQAAASARQITSIVAEVVQRETGLSREEAAWLVQMSRLIAEATEWRTLAEPNRDAFLAENLAWLLDEAFPGSRIVALAHRSHSERRVGRMGSALAALVGTSYRSISMLPLAGEYRNFGDVTDLISNAPLQTFRIGDADVGSLERELTKLSPSDAIVSLAGSGKSDTPPASADPAPLADIAILVGRVTASRPLCVVDARACD